MHWLRHLAPPFRESLGRDKWKKGSTGLLRLTTLIVEGYVGNNRLEAGELTALIQSVHGALTTAGQPKSAPEMTDKVTPVEIKNSIRPAALI